jgi:DnaJ-class molecular chaperone
MTHATDTLRRDDANLLADSGAEILADDCHTCSGTGLLVGLSCPICSGDGATYRVASYSSRLLALIAETASIVTARRPVR